MTDKNKLEQKEITIVKGYLRPDGAYYLSIPKNIRQSFDLKGGEYFLIKAKPTEKKISAKMIEVSDEQFE